MLDKPIETGEGTACEARRTSPYCLSEASLRANVPSNWLRAASCILRLGVAGGTGGIPPVLLFFCRRFLFQIKRKCRNAESVKSLIIVGREGSKPIINKSKLLYRLSPIADSREGCPYKLHSNKIVQISRADNTRPKQLCRFIILQ